MLSFAKYWLNCFCDGWHIADGIINIIGILAMLVTGILLWRKKWNKHRKHWEEFVLKTTLIIFVGAFFVSTVFVAPFLKHDSQTHTISGLTKELEKSRDQNPINQHQIVLIYDARVLAKHLPEIGPEDRDNFFESHEFFWLQRLCNDLQAQGLKVDKIKEIYQKDGINQKTLNQMADELNRLANELLKINKTIENKGENKS